MITIGLDIGSVAAKGVMLTPERSYTTLLPTGWSPKAAGQALTDDLLKQVALTREEVSCTIATGYGRIAQLDADKTVTEITCHARGIAELLPTARMIIDIGGQDSKVILTRGAGKVSDFAMNDKCAAGTGRFLQVMATIFGLDVADLGQVEDPTQAVAISSMCTVFAESEVISQLANGIKKEGLIAGLHQAVAKRVAAMAHRLGVNGPIAFTGGVALNKGVQRALQSELGVELLTHPECQFSGALGAALIARDLAAKR